MNSDRAISLTLMAALALVGYREIKVQNTLPRPHALLGAAAAYSMLFLLGGFAPELATVLAVGLLIGLAMTPGILTGRAAGSIAPGTGEQITRAIEGLAPGASTSTQRIPRGSLGG